MYDFIRGKLIHSSPHASVIDAGGIGYKLHIAANAFGKMPQIGDELLLHSSFQVRDKLDMLYLPDTGGSPIALRESQTVSDAMSALIHLGYNQSTAQKAIKSSLADLPDNPDLAMLITHALKNI